MPAVKLIKTNQHQVLLWKIEEDLDFFSQQITLSFEESQEYSYIKTENRKLEWMAARFVQRQVIDDNLSKDGFGKPHLKSKKGNISISHCKNYAVAAFSQKEAIGVDIEPIHEKILRIASKFMNEKEFAFINKEHQTAHLIACWCIKEAVYKHYGKKSLNFKEQIIIQNFDFNANLANVNLILNQEKLKLEVQLYWFEDLVLAFV